MFLNFDIIGGIKVLHTKFVYSESDEAKTVSRIKELIAEEIRTNPTWARDNLIKIGLKKKD